MAQKKRQRVVLVSPDGRKYATSDPAEITQLRSQGYAPQEAPESTPPASRAPARPAAPKTQK